MTDARRTAALEIAESLLTEIELSKPSLTEIALKASRLARLTDDLEALRWFQTELEGYPEKTTKAVFAIAERSGRTTVNEDGEVGFRSVSLSSMQLFLEVNLKELKSASGIENMQRLYELKTLFISRVYQWATDKQVELRFGAVADEAFRALSRDVDERIARLVPQAAIKLAAAFESVSSSNSEHWANAASECRRVIKAVADALRPPGPKVGERSMTDANYINRLIDWIQGASQSETMRKVVVADLEDFGRRIDAMDRAGQKGAHGEVTQYDAARFVMGAYLLLGDLLNHADLPNHRS